MSQKRGYLNVNGGRFEFRGQAQLTEDLQRLAQVSLGQRTLAAETIASNAGDTHVKG